MTADQPAEVRDRLAALLPHATVYLEFGLQATYVVVRTHAGHAVALADRLAAGDAAVAALARGIAVCDELIDKACDPHDHSDENMLARVCLPIVGLIRDAIDGTGDGGEQ